MLWEIRWFSGAFNSPERFQMRVTDTHLGQESARQSDRGR